MERVQIRRACRWKSYPTYLTRKQNEPSRADHETAQSQHSGTLISRGVARLDSMHRGGGLLLSFSVVRIPKQ
jgi:hypothetical protein